MCPQPRVKRQIDFFGQKQAINGTTPETLTVATREGIMLLFSLDKQMDIEVSLYIRRVT